MADTTSEFNYDGSEAIEFECIFVNVEENGSKINILANDEHGGARTLKIGLKGYDEANRKWVDDEEVKARAESLVQDSFGMSVEELIESGGFGAKFQAYTDGERASMTPIKPYVAYDRIDTATSKALKRLSGPFDPTRVTEYDGHRFNFGIKAEIGGEDMKFRVSQLKIESDDDDVEDSVYSVKYTNKDIDNFRGQIENGDMPADTVAKMKSALENLIQRSRAEKIAQLSQVLGVDVEKMLEGVGGIVFKDVEVNQIPGTKDVYFLVGTVDLDETKSRFEEALDEAEDE